MNQPTECKYCGCEEVATKTDCEIVFRCWSSYLSEDDYWTVSNNCGARCAVQLVELRERIHEFMKAREANFVTLNERIKRAVEVLEGARRYDFVDGYLPCMSRRSDGEFIEHDEAEQVIEILSKVEKGETDGQAD